MNVQLDKYSVTVGRWEWEVWSATAAGAAFVAALATELSGISDLGTPDGFTVEVRPQLGAKLGWTLDPAKPSDGLPPPVLVNCPECDRETVGVRLEKALKLMRARTEFVPRSPKG